MRDHGLDGSPLTADDAMRIAACVGKVWKQFRRRSLDGALRDALASVLLECRSLMVPSNDVKPVQAIAESRYDIRLVVPMLRDLASPSVAHCTSCEPPAPQTEFCVADSMDDDLESLYSGSWLKCGDSSSRTALPPPPPPPITVEAICEQVGQAAFALDVELPCTPSAALGCTDMEQFRALLFSPPVVAPCTAGYCAHCGLFQASLLNKLPELTTWVGIHGSESQRSSLPVSPFASISVHCASHEESEEAPLANTACTDHQFAHASFSTAGSARITQRRGWTDFCVRHYDKVGPSDCAVGRIIDVCYDQANHPDSSLAENDIWVTGRIVCVYDYFMVVDYGDGDPPDFLDSRTVEARESVCA